MAPASGFEKEKTFLEWAEEIARRLEDVRI